MSHRWFVSSVALGAAADATSVTGARPSFSPAVKITRTLKDQPGETFPDRPGPSLQLLGPGDTVGFDQAAVVRQEPPAGCPNGVANYLAQVEFSDASLPWLLSLPGPGRLPWLVLLVLREDEGGLQPGSPLPVVEVPGTALPDLADSWAWVHVEARVEDGDTPDGAVTRDVRSGVDTVVSRLICPRELEPDKGWLACVVPATKAGAAAGLGADPPADGAAPAWTAGQSQARLPVYHSWRFRTGDEGSFEDLARRVEPVASRDLPGFGSRTVDVRHPWPLRDLLEDVAPERLTVPVHGALRVPGTDTADEVWSDAASMFRFRELLTGQLDAPGLRHSPAQVGAPPDRDEKTVAPPLYGSHHTGVQTVPADGWMNRLNTRVKYRIAAALGARYVQLEQEFLMARAWEQIGAVTEANRALAAAELAAESARAAQDKHLGGMDAAALTELSPYRDVFGSGVGRGGLADDRSGVARGALAAVGSGVGNRTLADVLAPSAVPNGVASSAFVRLTRRGGALRRRTGRVAQNVAAGVLTTDAFVDGALKATKTSLPSMWLAGVEQAQLPPPVAVVQGPMATSTVIGDPSAVFASQTLSEFVFTMWLVAVDYLAEGVGRLFPEFGNPREKFEALFAKMQDVATDRGPRSMSQPALVRGVHRMISAEPFAAPLFAAADLGSTARALIDEVRDGVRPVPRQLDRMGSLLGPAVMGGRSEADARPLRPIMAHPEFGFPIAAELVSRWPEWAVPGVSAFPDEASTLLEPNPAFVEALLVGLNQEFNRELRWREYPTDEAGTPFSRFWPPGGARPGYGEIARWAAGDALGEHDPQQGDDLLVLLIRGEVLRRYPGTVVLAAKSVDRTVEGPDVQWKEPSFVLPVDERTNLYGFSALTAAQAVAEHWMFVMREPMRGVHFGFDLRTAQSPPFTSWADLTWDEVPTVNGFVVPRVVDGKPPALPGPADPPKWEGLDAADFARIVFQQPFQLAFSANRMIG
ncbi:hypothetical protein J5Y04_37200 [Kitasatospora sp. RG8]|uniref:hypothetical protein n=1 Tax=Kitasatospora sp. RG8 TaxID=2820815 RepID=UPI001ADFE481|nr:hypothetical protein [Kitasatospora sp. RG8]MBP0455114.1 hypothetical protein [Kitasatospora sp. RG8]